MPSSSSLSLGLLVILASCGSPEPAPAQDTTPLVGVAPAQGSPQPAQLVRRERLFGAMGTEVSIEAIGPDAALLERALEAAEAELRRVEDLATSWRDSPLTRLNASAGSGPHLVPPELARLVGRGLAVGELTHGAFDVTFASVGKLWDFKAKPAVLPSPEQVQSALQAVGFDRVRIDLEASTIELPIGTRLGLGGIAKGYSVDRAMQTLLDHGIKHGIVNAGGDMKVLGTRFGKAWRIAIKHPREREKVLAMVPISNLCMVTSGDYERFFEHEGSRYHHILDPRTGYPATGGMSVTVIAPEAGFADALATALAVLGPERGIPLVEGLERVECLIVDMQGKLHSSSGLPGLSKGK